jgi:hypothetical protein
MLGMVRLKRARKKMRKISWKILSKSHFLALLSFAKIAKLKSKLLKLPSDSE